MVEAMGKAVGGRRKGIMYIKRLEYFIKLNAHSNPAQTKDMTRLVVP